MDSILERAEKATDKEINRVRWALGINGVLSLAFGVAVIVWPGISLRALTIVFGVYAAISGVVALSAVLSGLVRQGRGWLVLWSLADSKTTLEQFWQEKKCLAVWDDDCGGLRMPG